MDEIHTNDGTVDLDAVMDDPEFKAMRAAGRKWVPTVLSLHAGRMAYVSLRKGRFLRRPYRVEKWICSVWNYVACACLGHDRVLEGIPETHEDGMAVCPHCCARYQPR